MLEFFSCDRTDLTKAKRKNPAQKPSAKTQCKNSRYSIEIVSMKLFKKWLQAPQSRRSL